MSTPQHNEALHPREQTGKFATKPVADAAGGMDALGTQAAAAAAPAGPFQFDRNSKNYEQVRPHFEAYMGVRRELDEAGEYPYNDSFKGRIPGIVGPDEDTAIYMLQQMRQRDEMNAKLDAFLADGGEQIAVDDLKEGEQVRGTIVAYGFYMGGTGWKEYESARLVKDRGGLTILPKGRRTAGYAAGSNVLIKKTGR